MCDNKLSATDCPTAPDYVFVLENTVRFFMASFFSRKVLRFIPSNYMEVLAVSDQLLVLRKSRGAPDLVKPFLYAALA